jgi:cytochrome c biogenesis protein CcmG, thiol:disulfide interchange protein DsbE
VRRPGTAFLLFLTLAVAAVPASFLIRRVGGGRDLEPLRTGPAPAFTLAALDGSEVSLAGLRGQPVVVNFWGSWCLQCRKELGVLAEVRKRRPDLLMLGIVFRDPPDQARRAAEEAGAGWPQLVDVNERVARAYGVDSAPATFLIGPDGTIEATLVGPVTRAIIERQLSGLS